MALPNINIGVGAPPLIWSNVQEAFDKINDNFTALDLATGGVGGAVDLSFLTTDVSPNTSNTYTLGTFTRTWKNVYTAEWSEISGSELNGLWLGTAHIKGISGTVDLPLNSTIDGDLIIDPNKTTFKTINVESVGEIVANSFTDTLNLIAGDGISLSVSSGADSITFDNTGVITVTGSTYLTVTETTQGDFTFTNNGVTNVTNTTALPSGRVTGTGIHVDSATGGVKLTNTGVISIESSSPALTVFTDNATGIVTLTNNAPLKPAFDKIQVSGQTTINAGGIEATLTVAAGYGLSITTTPLLRTLTIGLDRTAGAIDLSASIFGDDSTLLVDGVNSLIPAEVVQGTFTGTVIGNVTGALTGNADTATASTKVRLVASDSTAAAHYITFVDAATGDEEVRTDTGLTYNPSTNSLTTSTFVGALTGNADTATTASRATQVTLIATNTAAATHFITFVDAATGDENVRTDTDLTYNPSTNTLTVVNISGTTITANLVGNSTGYHTGDVKGSVVGDDSTILVDGVSGIIRGRVETTTVRASTFIKTAVYANDTARNLAIPTPEVGMIIFNTTTGKFEGNIDGTVLGWTALN
jgi:hypothetical protein